MTLGKRWLQFERRRFARLHAHPRMFCKWISVPSVARSGARRQPPLGQTPRRNASHSPTKASGWATTCNGEQIGPGPSEIESPSHSEFGVSWLPAAKGPCTTQAEQCRAVAGAHFEATFEPDAPRAVKLNQLPCLSLEGVVQLPVCGRSVSIQAGRLGFGRHPVSRNVDSRSSNGSLTRTLSATRRSMLVKSLVAMTVVALSVFSTAEGAAQIGNATRRSGANAIRRIGANAIRRSGANANLRGARGPLNGSLTDDNAPSGGGICGILSQDLPSFCTCNSSSLYEATVQCMVNFLDIDEVGLQATFSPCSDPATLDLDIVEEDLGTLTWLWLADRSPPAPAQGSTIRSRT